MAGSKDKATPEDTEKERQETNQQTKTHMNNKRQNSAPVSLKVSLDDSFPLMFSVTYYNYNTMIAKMKFAC